MEIIFFQERTFASVESYPLAIVFKLLLRTSTKLVLTVLHPVQIMTNFKFRYLP